MATIKQSSIKPWRDVKSKFAGVIARFNSVIRAIRPRVDADTAQRQITRLSYLLRNPCAQDEDLYAVTLQVYLLTLGIEWPRGVFKLDIQDERTWKVRPALGAETLKSYRKGVFGWRKLVQRFYNSGNFASDTEALSRHLRRSAIRELKWLEDAYDLLTLTNFFASRTDGQQITTLFNLPDSRASTIRSCLCMRVA
jgi:hypothetical protein